MEVKLATGTYTVQSIRVKLASQPGNGTCLLCQEAEETNIIFYLNSMLFLEYSPGSDHTIHR